jgi:hypothetical protein
VYDTLELRWILDGPLPHGVVEWFGGAEPYERTDRYLALGPGPALGVKVRGGSTLEIKALAADRGSRAFGAGATGRVEAWSKWSVDVDPGWPEAALDGHWAPVRKTRRLRRFVPAGPSDAPAAVAGRALGMRRGAHGAVGVRGDLLDARVRGFRPGRVA